jgi:hypothetical protein
MWMNHSGNGNESLFSYVEYNITSPNSSLESVQSTDRNQFTILFLISVIFCNYGFKFIYFRFIIYGTQEEHAQISLSELKPSFKIPY